MLTKRFDDAPLTFGDRAVVNNAWDESTSKQERLSGLSEGWRRKREEDTDTKAQGHQGTKGKEIQSIHPFTRFPPQL